MKKMEILLSGALALSPFLLVGCDDTKTSRSGSPGTSQSASMSGAQSGAAAGAGQTGSTAAFEADRQTDLNNTPGMQTFTGVLLDANCDAVRNAAAAPDPTGGARTGDTGSGGSAGNPNAVKPETSGEAAKRATGAPQSETAPGSPDRASAAVGTTGSGTGRTEAGPTSGTLGAGDRGMGQPNLSSPMPNQYSRCAATQATNAYAIFASGRVLRLDSGSNSMVRQQLSSNLRSAEGAEVTPLHVQVTGSVQNNQLRASSVKRVGVGDR